VPHVLCLYVNKPKERHALALCVCRRERDVKLGLRDNVRAPGVDTGSVPTLCTACECVYLEADLLEELSKIII
jgi:hypothetical protein